jgi:Lon protease-like protein
MPESAHSQATIPLFPLGVVLMPHIHLPLHIFEERYKLMIKECLAQNTEFGIVYFNGKKLMSAGCTAKIIKVLKYYDDGRCDIITCGEKRFTINQIYDRSAYLQAQVAFFDDQDEANPEICRQLAQQGLDLLKQFDDISGQQDEISSSYPGDIKSLSFQIAGCDGFDLTEKQKFLEMTSTYERLRKSTESLGKILERIKLNSAISKIINGNGNLSKYSSESAE